MDRLLWLKFKRKDPSLAQRLPLQTAKFPAWLYWIQAHLFLGRLTEYTRQQRQICLLRHSIQVCTDWGAVIFHLKLTSLTHALCNTWGTAEPQFRAAGITSNAVRLTVEMGQSTLLEQKNIFLALDGKGVPHSNSKGYDRRSFLSHVSITV